MRPQSMMMSSSMYPFLSVMRTETVGQGQDWCETKNWVLVLQLWCYVVKHGLDTLGVIMILKDTATFKVQFIVSLFCACNISTVEINSAVHLLKSQICQVTLFASGGLCLGLVILVLVLRMWSCLHHRFYHSTSACIIFKYCAFCKTGTV